MQPVVVSEANCQLRRLRNECKVKRVGCEDGRAHSPGHSSMKLAYTFIDYTTGHVHSETVDKREVENKSPRIEREACKHGMTELQKTNEIGKLVTTVHSGIKKMLKVQFSTMKHSMDLWHKAKMVAEKFAEWENRGQNVHCCSGFQTCAIMFDMLLLCVVATL